MKPIYFQEFVASEEKRREAWARAFSGRAGWVGREPNAGHMGVARLVAQGKAASVITQNVDGLHQAAGSRNVVELHGTLDRVVYQSPDEINSDRMGVYALNLTENAAFEAQEDPSTPMQRSGSYVAVDMIFHIEMQLTALSAVWAGGSWYLLRLNVTPPLPSADSLVALLESRGDLVLIAAEPGLDETRVAVYGGSYGGYMVLATSARYSDKLSAAVDIVGISNFVTFLEQTKPYRQDLRRAEYGDERDPDMRAVFEQINPTARAELGATGRSLAERF